MRFVTTALATLLLAPQALAVPAMVTTTRGAVQLVEGEIHLEAPPPPFLFDEGQVLTLEEGALVVVLFEGNATQVIGPTALEYSALKTSETAREGRVAVLDEVLSRHVSTAPTGASRPGVVLTRPIPNSAMTKPTEIRWACATCETQQMDVAITDLFGEETLWNGSGDGSATVEGVALEPGSYQIVLDGFHLFSITILKEDQQTRAAEVATAAREAADALGKDADPAARTSVIASVYLQMELPTEALYAIDAAIAAHPDDAALKALRGTFEARLGLPK